MPSRWSNTMKRCVACIEPGSGKLTPRGIVCSHTGELSRIPHHVRYRVFRASVPPPYSKNCHIKNFGTKDLRHANLPNRDQVMGLSPPTSPGRNTSGLESPPSPPPRPTSVSIESKITGGSFTVPPPKPLLANKLKVAGEAELHSGGGVGMNDLPGRSPISPAKCGGDDDRGVTQTTLGRKDMIAALIPTSTGTRYGRGLTGGTSRQWGGGTPVCGKCGKLVYFAEQVSEGEERESGSDIHAFT